MGADQATDWRRAAASALEWWRDAGVDLLVDDDGHDWFAAPPAPPPAAVAPTVAAAVAAAEALPDTLEAFARWRVSDASPEGSWGVPPVAVSTLHRPALMVLTDMPEADAEPGDGPAAGPVGRLLDGMLAAIGHGRDGTAIASLAVARPLAGRLPRASLGELERLARHHVALTQPRLLLLLGAEACRAILGDDSARGGLRTLNHDDVACRVVASFHPRFLLTTPQAKAEAWRDLQLLIREPDA